MEVFRKRGYVKWWDEDGVKHKVPEAEYDKQEEAPAKVTEEVKNVDENMPAPVARVKKNEQRDTSES